MKQGKLKTEGKKDGKGVLNQVHHIKFKPEEAPLTLVSQGDSLEVFEMANKM